VKRNRRYSPIDLLGLAVLFSFVVEKGLIRGKFGDDVIKAN
jgi:hypothetical protein